MVKTIDKNKAFRHAMLSITTHLDRITFPESIGGHTRPDGIIIKIDLSKRDIIFSDISHQFFIIGTSLNAFSVHKPNNKRSILVLVFGYDEAAQALRSRWKVFFDGLQVRARSKGGKEALKNWDEVKKILHAFKIIITKD